MQFIITNKNNNVNKKFLVTSVSCFQSEGLASFIGMK